MYTRKDKALRNLNLKRNLKTKTKKKDPKTRTKLDS